MDMQTLWISILLGFASLVSGFFNGHEAPFRPFHIPDGDAVATKSQGFKSELPHVRSFYLKLDDPHFKLKPVFGPLSLSPADFRKGLSSVQSAAEFPEKFPENELHGGLELEPPRAPESFLPSEEAPPLTNEHRLKAPEQRVVGGRDVADGEIPWQVSLQRKSMKSGRIFHICGGSIINREWVVTAAHCVALALLSNYRIVAATTNLKDENRIKGLNSPDYSVHKVVDVHIHDEYDMFRFLNDIALIRVEPPFEYGHKIQAISLPHAGHRAHGMAYASGWGLTQEGVRVTPSRLQAVELPIVSDGECRQAYGDNLAATMICAGYREGGRSVCQGDSGGPLFQNQGGQAVLIGVVSWGVGCARPGKPGVYTEVSHYVGWIDEMTGGRGGRQNFIH